MAKERILWLDRLRGIGMFFVVAGHAQAIPSEARILIYAFHMPLFFMISGFLFRDDRYKNLLHLIGHKAKTLLVPYVVLYAINIPLWYVAVQLPNGGGIPLKKLAIGFLTAGASGISVDMPLWFLVVLFFSTILFWIIVKVHKKTKIPLFVFMAIVFAAGAYLSMNFSGKFPLRMRTIPMATVFIWLGYLFGRNWKALFAKAGIDSENPNRRFDAVIVGSLTIGLIVAHCNGKISMMINDYHNVFLMVIAACLISLAVTMIAMKLPKLTLLEFSGKYSLQYLGLHRNVVYALQNWVPFSIVCVKSVLITTLITYIICIPLTLLYTKAKTALYGAFAKNEKGAAPSIEAAPAKDSPTTPDTATPKEADSKPGE